MKAFQFETVAAGLELQDVPVPEPGYEQVLIAVKAAGLCHSDIHSLTLGHEVTGTVVKLGPGASAFPFKKGDRVMVALLDQPVIDRDFQEAIGVGYDGGYAKFAVAYCKELVKIPAGVSFAQAAVATDSMCEAKVTKPTCVAVIGLGGLGHNGVAIAAIQGAEVYGVDINTTKFDQALKAGAIKCASSLDQFLDIFFDEIFDFAGMQSTIAAAVSTVKLGGCVVLVGLGSPTRQLETTSIVTRNIQLRGPVSASIDDLHKVLVLIATGSLSPTVQEIPFLDVPKGLEILHKNDVNGRLFTIPI
ncbi:chaperonin 10-like protein [Ilyonectria destructans]|nr:chaperonin 10-like protein [Ilyonectria destructans]